MAGDTAIPFGTYPVTFERSPRLSDKYGHDFYTPRMHDIPGFDGVLWHIGNYPKDTIGCILLGTSKAKDFIGGSADACKIGSFNLFFAYNTGLFQLFGSALFMAGQRLWHK